MVTVDLNEADRAALIALLKQAIAADPFPMSHRTRLLRTIVAKLEGQRETPNSRRQPVRDWRKKGR